jgi:hypothetical protein
MGKGKASTTHRRDKSVQKNMVRRPEGKRPLGKSRCRWKVNTKIDLKEL